MSGSVRLPLWLLFACLLLPYNALAASVRATRHEVNGVYTATVEVTTQSSVPLLQFARSPPNVTAFWQPGEDEKFRECETSVDSHWRTLNGSDFDVLYPNFRAEKQKEIRALLHQIRVGGSVEQEDALQSTEKDFDLFCRRLARVMVIFQKYQHLLYNTTDLSRVRENEAALRSDIVHLYRFFGLVIDVYRELLLRTRPIDAAIAAPENLVLFDKDPMWWEELYDDAFLEVSTPPHLQHEENMLYRRSAQTLHLVSRHVAALHFVADVEMPLFQYLLHHFPYPSYLSRNHLWVAEKATRLKMVTIFMTTFRRALHLRPSKLTDMAMPLSDECDVQIDRFKRFRGPVTQLMDYVTPAAPHNDLQRLLPHLVSAVDSRYYVYHSYPPVQAELESLLPKTLNMDDAVMICLLEAASIFFDKSKQEIQPALFFNVLLSAPWERLALSSDYTDIVETAHDVQAQGWYWMTLPENAPSLSAYGLEKMLKSAGLMAIAKGVNFDIGMAHEGRLGLRADATMPVDTVDAAAALADPLLSADNTDERPFEAEGLQDALLVGHPLLSFYSPWRSAMMRMSCDAKKRFGLPLLTERIQRENEVARIIADALIAEDEGASHRGQVKQKEKKKKKKAKKNAPPSAAIEEKSDEEEQVPLVETRVEEVLQPVEQADGIEEEGFTVVGKKGKEARPQKEALPPFPLPARTRTRAKMVKMRESPRAVPASVVNEQPKEKNKLQEPVKDQESEKKELEKETKEAKEEEKQKELEAAAPREEVTHPVTSENAPPLDDVDVALREEEQVWLDEQCAYDDGELAETQYEEAPCQFGRILSFEPVLTIEHPDYGPMVPVRYMHPSWYETMPSPMMPMPYHHAPYPYAMQAPAPYYYHEQPPPATYYEEQPEDDYHHYW